MAYFAIRLVENLKRLSDDLLSGQYRHSGYRHFRVNDPKPRDIHQAAVRDRIVHHTLYRHLYGYFDRSFIFDSYSCRIDKGSHRALKRFREFSLKVSRNHTKTAWVLKGDIRKCFASVDHRSLKEILDKHILCPQLKSILYEVIDSFNGEEKVGIPLGNLTSQLFMNIYLNKLDHFIKRVLKVRYYIRYADDMIFFCDDQKYLEELVPKIRDFLFVELKLSLHPKKLEIRTLASGVDFLGAVFFPDHLVLRPATRRRLRKKLNDRNTASYLGLAKHCNGWKLEQEIFAIINGWKK